MSVSESNWRDYKNGKYESMQEKLKDWISGYKGRIPYSTDTLTLKDVVEILEEFVND